MWWAGFAVVCLATWWALRAIERRLRARDLAAARRIDAQARAFVSAQRAEMAADVAAGRLAPGSAAALEVLLARLAEPSEAVVRRIYDGR